MRRPKKQPARDAAHVKLREPVVSPADLLVTLTQHTLFMHQQIPMTYSELVREGEDATAALAEGKRLRPAGSERKTLKLLKSMEPLLASLASALAASGGSNESARPILAAVLLGSSIASPRLVYLLRVSAAATAPASAAVAATLAETAGAPAADAAAPSSRDATRRLLRAIATQCNSLSTIDPKLCRLHVALRAPREAELSPGLFQPRPGLALRLQRAHVATVTVTSVAGPDEDGDEWSDRAGLVCGFELPPPRPHADLAGGGMGAAAAATAAEGASEPDAAPPGPDGADGCIWWTSRALVKGFRLKKNPFEG